ncbi:MAG TPA: efflux RND transporter periplasmic adaptor subunit [Bryobacteraceae bacterium]|nr:efflux RND transporter periplasmic adaptor subunit [Bryobacteraceae bacterium]
MLGLLLLFVGGGAALVYYGINSRIVSAKALATETRANSVLSVSVVAPKIGGAEEEVVLPGNTQAFTDSPIYARTTGYLKKWYADIGMHVKAGELLAEIDAPELDHQLQQARADLETAQANLKLAQSTAERWQFLLKTQSVSRQETDEKTGDLNAKKAMVDASTSAVHRLEDLQSYEKVTAPFDGVITARNTDVGALIDAGANTPARELFHLAATNQLRVFVNVPEPFSRAARAGAKATLQLSEYPGRNFTGTIVRNASAIDTTSRTLLVEVDVDNPTGELLPGAYVSVHLKLPGGARQGLTIPANTILFRSEGLRVGVVRDGHAQLVPITVGRDYGNELEVLTGLTLRDRLIANPADSLVSGEPVRIAINEGNAK